MNKQKDINIKKLKDDAFLESFIKENNLKAKNTIIITGPTAIGKSKFALNLAQKLDGVIINADSLQVYKDLSVLSARPSNKESEVTHHKLYGYMDINQTCSAAAWLDMATKEINKAHANNKTAILVGGTGMYIRTLYQGIITIPSIPEHIICESKDLINTIGNEAFFKKLCNLDPKAEEKLHPNDTQRILRAYNVIKHTGKSLFEFHTSQVKKDEIQIDKQMIVMLPKNKADLLEKATKRLEKMIDQDCAIDEVKALIKIIDKNKLSDKQISPTITKAIGVQQIMDYLYDKITLGQAKDLAKIATNQYIKRQITWIKNQFIKNEEINSIILNLDLGM